ncbi:zinc finger and BTB domain-containing protein 49 [Bacillus rossius redtenbacheri]|uniref:zinc finger and BTB domain-containing protein 49 n=1 Tax=Bacillus rossius redtenbacheri TaxID=93214 RepID=UPI002FDE30E2
MRRQLCCTFRADVEEKASVPSQCDNACVRSGGGSQPDTPVSTCLQVQHVRFRPEEVNLIHQCPFAHRPGAHGPAPVGRHAHHRAAPPPRGPAARQSLARRGPGMYSLYRAWLMRDAVLSTPPDVILHVGAASRTVQQFAAHRCVVAAHSGYLKALLPAAGEAQTETVSVSVPNVSPDVFASLLTFMYTGYMDVTHENIYAVLLATHLLHMPRALDLCRSFLVQNQQPPPQQQLPTLVKPIPSRKMLPVVLFPPPSAGPYWPPPSLLLPTDNSPFRSVAPAAEATLAVPSTSSAAPATPAAPAAPAAPAGRLPSPPNTSESSSPLLAPALLPRSSASKKETSRSDNQKNPHKVTNAKENRRVHEKSEHTPTDHSVCTSTNAASSGGKVIIDIACCDGPVRFHRVLNDNYGLTLDELLPDKLKTFFDINDKVTQKENERLCSEKIQLKMLKTVNETKILSNEGSNATQLTSDECIQEPSCSTAGTKVMEVLQPQTSSTEYLSKTSSNVTDYEDSSMTKGSNHSTGPNNNGIDTVYTCLYCNHAFKSHYCYQKHARRHINPVTIDLKCIADRLEGTNKNVPACKLATPEKPPTNSSTTINGKTKDKVRREVRLLDMNVQYYPCKTCGSKFPSYYFVHKHRKMCHANEETDSLFGADDTHSLPHKPL